MAAEKAAESERRAKQDILDAELLMKRYESDVEKAKYGAISGGVVGAFNAFGRAKNDDKGEWTCQYIDLSQYRDRRYLYGYSN